MDVNTILIILGGVVLFVLIAHAIWTNRREKSQCFDNDNVLNCQSVEEKNLIIQPDVSEVEQSSAVVSPIEIELPKSIEDISQQQIAENVSTTAVEQSYHSADQIRVTLPQNKSSVTEQKVYYEYVPEFRSSSTNIANKTLAELSDYENSDEGIHSVSSDWREQLQQASLQFSSSSETKLQQSIQTQQQHHTQAHTTPSKTASDFALLYVVAPENEKFKGTALAYGLQNLGCILGEDNIYHRHVDNIATPIIFSVANVNQPGTFSYAMSDFSTVGVAFFMQIPSAVGNDKINLRMMIQAAKSLAKDLRGFVLTDQQQLFDKNAEQDYLARLQ